MRSPGPPLVACIVSPHVFLIQELARVLQAAHIESSSHRIEYSLAPRVQCDCPPERRVWVVDACLPAQAMESLVTGLRALHPAAPLVAVADELSDDLVFPLLRAGVRGFLTYADTQRRLPEVVAAMAQGRTWIPRAQLAAFVELLLGLAQPPRAVTAAALSQREKDVLPLVLQNLANKEIADRLSISERTVKFHVSNLLAKFGVERRSDLILQALRGRPA